MDEHRRPHAPPWVIGWSGGKDSTVVAHLVREMLLDLPRSARHRPAHIVANNTLVESPPVVAHIRTMMARFRDAAGALRLPLDAEITARSLALLF